MGIKVVVQDVLDCLLMICLCYAVLVLLLSSTTVVEEVYVIGKVFNQDRYIKGYII